jgi:hypothetical protein
MLQIILLTITEFLLQVIFVCYGYTVSVECGISIHGRTCSQNLGIKIKFSRVFSETFSV